VRLHSESGWTGDWVSERLGMTLVTTDAPLGIPLHDLVGLAVRRNPRRAHLLVSRVLGKHVPTDPRLVYGAGLLLGELVRRRLAGEGGIPVAAAELLATALSGGAGDALRATEALPSAAAAASAHGPGAFPDAVVLGYAETATALGHAVADALRTAVTFHSTRRSVAGVQPVGGFAEEHSHATEHRLLPEDPSLLLNDLPLVLVDDELSTGTTVTNTVAALQRIAPRDRYVVATLVDLRSEEARERMRRHARRLGTRIDVVSLASGVVQLPPDVLTRGTALVEQVAGRMPGVAGVAPPGVHRPTRVRTVHLGWPGDLPATGLHGYRPGDRKRFEAFLPAAARALAAEVGGQTGRAARVLLLGVEELMYVPLRLAVALAEVGAQPTATGGDGHGALEVRYSTTTRSPVLAVDEAGYAIRTRLVFPAHDDPEDGAAERYAYNVAPASGEERYDTVVLVLDAACDTPAARLPGGLLDRLASCADEVLVTTVPARVAPALPSPLRGPAFGSYAADEVTWLLTDLSDVTLEAPTEEREEAIQAGGAHYAESLPIEYQPSADYQRLFSAALEASAERVAHAVGVVTEMVLAARGDAAVLVSLARAGTPIGILMRRWAARHGLSLPHYAVSIVRGRGIDDVALRYLAAHHDPASVMFVDGWTGKGAIARELAAALDAHAEATGVRFPGDLAVLADPGRCVEIFGTREDFLIPSACLNSTVSGLVSRTVLNPALTGPGDFHGAKFYAGLAPADVSNTFLDAVSERFDAVAEAVTHDWPLLAAADPGVTWEGLAAVERISADYGIGDVNLIKPGVGETTRVLLRRVPWRVLVRAEAYGELAHVRLLADQRGVPVDTVADLPYSCVGLIHPRFTRGATGADGTAAATEAT
jgi:hypothetical protein